jgi:hypothetical protein
MKYLDQEIIQDPNSVEEIFCKPLDEKGKRVPLSEHLMKLLIHTATSKPDEIDSLYKKVKDDWALLSILEDRLRSLNCQVEKAPLIVTSMTCKTPGECVMYANYLAYASKKLGLTSMTLTDLCTDVFPFGFFDEETLRTHWDIQKVHSNGTDNLLDYLSAAESLIVK